MSENVSMLKKYVYASLFSGCDCECASSKRARVRVNVE